MWTCDDIDHRRSCRVVGTGSTRSAMVVMLGFESLLGRKVIGYLRLIAAVAGCDQLPPNRLGADVLPESGLPRRNLAEARTMSIDENNHQGFSDLQCTTNFARSAMA